MYENLVVRSKLGKRAKSLRLRDNEMPLKEYFLEMSIIIFYTIMS